MFLSFFSSFFMASVKWVIQEKNSLATWKSLINNAYYISFLFFSFRATHDTLHKVFTPLRIYYQLTRWFFGNSYNPFKTNIEDGMHPLISFILRHHWPIRVIYYGSHIIAFTIIIAVAVHFVQKLLLQNLMKTREFDIQW